MGASEADVARLRRVQRTMTPFEEQAMRAFETEMLRRIIAESRLPRDPEATRSLAEAGDMLSLYFASFTGTKEEILRWSKAAVDHGNPGAYLIAADTLMGGDGEDRITAMAYVYAAARRGSVFAIDMYSNYLDRSELSDEDLAIAQRLSAHF